MKMRFKYGLFILILNLQATVFAIETTVYWQQIDSILEVNFTKIVYDNPDESIALGLSVFDNMSYSKKTRTKALMLATLGYTSKRDYQKALEYILKADEFSKDIEDKVLEIEILFRKGILYQQLKIFDKSIENLEKTEQLALLYPDRESVGKYLASSYVVKGFIYKDNLNCDIALEYFDKGINEYQNLKNTDVSTNLSIVYYNKGNCYTLLSEYAKAISSFEKSIQIAKLENAKSLIAFAQKGLAEVYTQQGKYQQAIALLHTALNTSRNVGDLVLNSGIYNGLFENNLAINQWEQYQKYYNLYSKTQLDIKISERNSISASLEESVRTQNQELNTMKQHLYNNIKWILGILLFAISLVLVVERKNLKDIKTLQNRVNEIQNQK